MTGQGGAQGLVTKVLKGGRSRWHPGTGYQGIKELPVKVAPRDWLPRYYRVTGPGGTQGQVTKVLQGGRSRWHQGQIDR